MTNSNDVYVISIKLDLFPGVEMVAFPRRERSDIP